MEEAWELAAVNWSKFVKFVFRENDEPVHIHIDPGDPQCMKFVREYYQNDLTDSKYLMVGNVAALIFLMKALEIDFGGHPYSVRFYLLPFACSFLASAYAYRKSLSIDTDWFLMELNGRVADQKRTPRHDEDLDILTARAKIKNNHAGRSTKVAIFSFSLGVVFLALYGLSFNVLGFLDRIL